MQLALVALILFFGWYLSNITIENKKEKSRAYIDLGDSCWLTPNGFLDMRNDNPVLQLKRKLNEIKNRGEDKIIKSKYEIERAFNDWEMHIKQYHLMKRDVEKISPEEKIEYWLPKWIDYMCQYHLREKNGHELAYGHMDFDVYIATEIIPFKCYGLRLIPHQFTARINYV